MERTANTPAPPTLAGIFLAFLKLGLTSFGGPIAHVGYMREAFVTRRKWLDDAQFAQLLALSQFLPGPASSQLGFAIGLTRGGGWGALAAFVAFTLPSVLLMFAFVALMPLLDPALAAALVHGLKLVAVAVVAHGLIGMARQLTPDLPRVLIALAAAALLMTTGNPWMQLLAIAAGAVLGPIACRRVEVPATRGLSLNFSKRSALLFFGLFAVGLLFALLLKSSGTATLGGLAAAFYRAGALVFGGGHVVLPLLQNATVAPGWLSQETFLAGYGAAQAMTGPMFSMAAFLGAEIDTGTSPFLSGFVALLAIFLPGALLLLAALPVWSRLSHHPGAVRAVAGINAAVVGILAAAFINPVCTQGLQSWVDIVIAGIAILLLVRFRVPALWIVFGCVAAAMLVAFV